MKKENVRNSKLSGTLLWFCAQVHGKVADDFIASKPSGALSWREEKRVFPPPPHLRPLPPGKLARAQVTLQTQFSYLLCDIMYIHVGFLDELLLTLISWHSWHDAIGNIQHKLSSLIRGNVPDLKNSRCLVVLSSIAKAAGR